jgi:hypothetical protein
MVEIVQVGSADAASLDGNLDLARAWCFGFAFLDPKVAGSMNDDSFHCYTPDTPDVIGRRFI